MTDTLNGFACGDYSCKCSECGKEFTGDKRAITCLSCAGETERKAGMEEAAVIAWSTGMDLHRKQPDEREVGSACAKRIRMALHRVTYEDLQLSDIERENK